MSPTPFPLKDRLPVEPEQRQPRGKRLILRACPALTKFERDALSYFSLRQTASQPRARRYCTLKFVKRIKSGHHLASRPGFASTREFPEIDLLQRREALPTGVISIYRPVILCKNHR